MSDYPILRLRATGPTGTDFVECSLDGKPIRVEAITLEMGFGEFTRATITFSAVLLDAELPVEITERSP